MLSKKTQVMEVKNVSSRERWQNQKQLCLGLTFRLHGSLTVDHHQRQRVKRSLTRPLHRPIQRRRPLLPFRSQILPQYHFSKQNYRGQLNYSKRYKHCSYTGDIMERITCRLETSRKTPDISFREVPKLLHQTLILI